MDMDIIRLEKITVWERLKLSCKLRTIVTGVGYHVGRRARVAYKKTKSEVVVVAELGRIRYAGEIQKIIQGIRQPGTVNDNSAPDR